MDPKLIAQLLEMGASRPAAISALRACKGDINEAANVVFDPLHAGAIVSDEDPQVLPTDASGPSTGPTSKPSTLANGGGSHVDENDSDDYDSVQDSVEEDDSGYEMMHDDADFLMNGDEETGADPFAHISFQKDRQKVMIEIEQPSEKVTLSINQSSEPAFIMPQTEWMKGFEEKNEQSVLFQIYRSLTDTHCLCPAENCNGAIQRKQTDFFAIPNTFASYIQHLEQVIQAKCPDCGRVICLACCDEVVPPKEPYPLGDAPDVLLHCPVVQAVILGVGLSYVEKMYYSTSQQPSGSSPNFRPSKKTKLDTPSTTQNDSSDDSADISHYAHRGSQPAPKGVGYGGSSSGQDDQSGQEAASKAQLLQDQALASLLASVRIFMPNRNRPNGYRHSDHMPSLAAAIHIRRRFNPIASELLKNDSLTDMSDRRILYNEFLQWLLIVSAHENTACIMGQPIMRVISTRYLPVTGKASGESSRQKEITYEGSAGPRELLEKLWRQVKAARRAIDNTKADPYAQNTHPLYHLSKTKETQEVEKLAAFCEQFEKAVNAIDRSLKSNNNEHVIEAIKRTLKVQVPISHDLSSASLETLKQRYVQWAENARYEYYDFEVHTPPTEGASGDATTNTPKYIHAYAKEILHVSSSYSARNTAIAKEHSTLSSALPVSWDSSVFLRVHESRSDVLKVLITGPEGTPYSNGCFVFDIFLTGNFNQTAPFVKSMTTKGGRFRLNPNLYADGKVCLSLLGTWQGPGWIPGKSTLLQVLISIQSMILNEEPYLNEPGWSKMGGTPQSRAYNLNVRRMVVDDAMLGSLKKPNPAFADVIKTHFKLKSQVIKAQLDQWLQEDDGQSIKYDSYSGGVIAASVGTGQDTQLKRNVEEMKRLLDELVLESGTVA
ncbi:hypothetical protein CROQUDRAFT_654953 [Cronartium quercuum f. sp. fusiforme G11]|uniref:UBC core domain-containing protein n=1 Tax=Cronartium quercuum f. sp. fusiforme G11 TaxID=708437 RepID=A0A9P6NK08_9BASI|nr:hypothetical protein CROQUDRAFT_654953 [Cronartium quercuum f. sp. fusiforme G11]